MKQDKKGQLLFKFYTTLYKTYGSQKWWPADTTLEIVIGAILTQNTSWTNVEKAISNLKKHNALNLTTLHKIQTTRLAGLIKPSGFFNQKAKTIKNFITFLYTQYNGKLENLFKEDGIILRNKLLQINGIGKETADSIILYAAKKPIFIVDKYTRRILYRHNIIDSENIEYDTLRKFIEKNIPEKVNLYNEFHALLVKVGKELCRKEPKCKMCPLNIYLTENYQ